MSAAMMNGRLPDSAHIGGAHLRVIDLDRALAFYVDLLGFTVVEREGIHAALAPASDADAADSAPILRLTAPPGAVRKPQRSTGLYHIAILLPSRPALGQMLKRLLTARYPLQGASDHSVSEALYLADPDGNGLEIYRDRPRADWRMNGSQIEMTTEALDLEGLLAQAAPDASWSGIPAQTVIGHVHLHVADLERAQAFYTNVVGFDLIMRMGGSAAFLSAGGYHHHLGVNTWAGRLPPPPNAAGLESFTITIPDADGWAQAVERTGAAVSGDAATLRDPDGNTVLLTQAQAQR